MLLDRDRPGRAEPVAHQLEELAAQDASVAPLALLYARAVRASADPSWAAGIPPWPDHAGRQGVPLLHGATLRVDRARLRALLDGLAALLAEVSEGELEPVRRSVASAQIDPLPLVQASLTQDVQWFHATAERVGVASAPLAVLAQQTAFPLLQACQRQAGALDTAAWGRGYCPVCGAWPTLAEQRGLDRQVWLCCGRCGAGWGFVHQRCAFCGNTDHRTQSYLAAEAERESRRVLACEQCHGYLKLLATLRPLRPAEMLLQDLRSLELDVAALQHGYARPEAPGFALELRLAAVPEQAGWLARWRR